MVSRPKSVAATIAAATTAVIGLGAPAAHAAVKPNADSPDINRVNCLTSGDSLVVYQSDYTNSDCFENAGGMNVKIYNVDDVYTGNNGATFKIGNAWCNVPYKNMDAVNWCGDAIPWGGTMTVLSIYPGTDY